MCDGTRLCRGCKRPFPIPERERHQKIWCSPACRGWALRYPGQIRPTGRLCRRPECGVNIDHRRISSVWCSKRCSEIVAGMRLAEPHAPRTCVECQGQYIPGWVQARYCSVACRQKYRGRIGNAAREAHLRGATLWDQVDPVEVFERDRWKCGVCLARIDRQLKWPHPMSATLDHLVPVSQGGEHTKANLRAAHFRCNVQRSNRGGGEQLALIG